MATVSWESLGYGSLTFASDGHFNIYYTQGYIFKVTVSGLSSFVSSNYTIVGAGDTAFTSGMSTTVYGGINIGWVGAGYTLTNSGTQILYSTTSASSTTFYLCTTNSSTNVYVFAAVPSGTMWGISSSGSAAAGTAAVATTLTATAVKPGAFYFINDGAYPALTTSKTQIRFCRASRWNALVDKINEWWAYKGRSGTSGCSYVSPGTVMLGYYVNQVETALNLLSNWNYFAINSPANTGVALADSWYSLAQTVINGLT